VDQQITLRREQADRDIQKALERSNSSAEINSIKQRCEMDCDAIRRSAEGQRSAAANASSQQTMTNLQAQLQDQKLTGSGVRLMPQGTGANVRNYETFHSDDDDRNAIIPLIARPQRLQDMEPTLKNSK
jgi:hypothetical protein